MLNQTDVGIMGVLIDGEKVISDSASDYYVLSKKNPELHDKLSAIFRHAGVDLPLGVDEPAVKRVALRMLGSLYSTDLTKLSVLIEQLDAAEFSTREEAKARFLRSIFGAHRKCFFSAQKTFKHGFCSPRFPHPYKGCPT